MKKFVQKTIKKEINQTPRNEIFKPGLTTSAKLTTQHSYVIIKAQKRTQIITQLENKISDGNSKSEPYQMPRLNNIQKSFYSFVKIRFNSSSKPI